MITHRAGERIALSSGEYSEFSFSGVYQLKIDADLPAMADAYAAQAPLHDCWEKVSAEEVEQWMYARTASGFGAYLVRTGVVAEIDYDEIHASEGEDFAQSIRWRCAARAARAAKLAGG